MLPLTFIALVTAPYITTTENASYGIYVFVLAFIIPLTIWRLSFLKSGNNKGSGRPDFAKEIDHKNVSRSFYADIFFI